MGRVQQPRAAKTRAHCNLLTKPSKHTTKNPPHAMVIHLDNYSANMAYMKKQDNEKKALLKLIESLRSKMADNNIDSDDIVESFHDESQRSDA